MTKKYVPEKSKTTAIVLAVLLGIWSWLYTYKYDACKFWIALLVNLVLFWTIVFPIGIWIWAIVDVCLKDERLYKEYFK